MIVARSRNLPPTQIGCGKNFAARNEQG